MNIENLQAWMQGYLRAWASNDPKEIGRLFAEEARYYTAPYRQPWTGRQGIVSGWLGRKDEPGTYEFRHEILGISGRRGFVRGWTTYYGEPQRVYSNLWVVELNDMGKCEVFTEWWMLED